MAKSSMLERERKRKRLSEQYSSKRKILLLTFKKLRIQRSSPQEVLNGTKLNSLETLFEINEKIQKLPKNSSPQRKRNRCWKTGRPRGYSKFFGLCRNALRDLAHNCLLPGVTKASW